jgi:hypothetical protein
MSRQKISAHPSGPGVWMPKSTLDSAAWNVLSDGSQRLYIALKAQADNKHNTAYLSTRDAAKALGRRSFRKIREWYAELRHYGFIVMLSAGCLGADGRGKAPLWRLSDKGTTRGGYEPPTQEFLQWDGVLFDPKPYRDGCEKIESRIRRREQGVTDIENTPVSHAVTLNEVSVSDVESICGVAGVSDVESITSLNHYVGSSETTSKPSSVEFGPNDPRIMALDAAAKRLKARRNDNGKRR